LDFLDVRINGNHIIEMIVLLQAIPPLPSTSSWRGT